MTEETKKLFDAPWHVFAKFLVDTADNVVVASVGSKTNANRLARLPELYDALMWSVVQKCPDAFLTLDECRLCADKKCEYREIIELLRKVRDGE